MLDINKILQQADGSDRELRPVQVEILRWIAQNWSSDKHLVVNAGVGVGKSMCARATQLATNGTIITPQNVLIEQYVETYGDDLNKLIGGANYPCSEYPGSKCNVATARYNCKGGVDSKCCYQNSQQAYLQGKPSILNVMSKYINDLRFKVQKGTVICDEAHSLPSILRQMTSTTLKFAPLERSVMKKLGFEKKDLTNELKLVKFLEAKIEKLDLLMSKTKDDDQLEKYFNNKENTLYTMEGFISNPELYCIIWDDGSLRVLPLKAPRKFIERVIGKNGVLFSATMLPHDTEEILGTRDYNFYDAGTPIPANQRQLIYDPADCGFSYDTLDPVVVAKKIMSIYNKTKEPTLVHCTYSLATKLRELMFDPSIIWHEKENKALAIERFKKEGGLLIGSGMSEGISLDGDICRQQILTSIQFPSLGDLFIKKRKLLPDGEIWYSSEALKILMQQVGRSTRGVDDWSKTYMIDSRFRNTYQKWKSLGLIPKYFAESVVF